MKSSLLISSNFVSNRVVSSNKAQITGAGHLALPSWTANDPLSEPTCSHDSVAIQ